MACLALALNALAFSSSPYLAGVQAPPDLNSLVRFLERGVSVALNTENTGKILQIAEYLQQLASLEGDQIEMLTGLLSDEAEGRLRQLQAGGGTTLIVGTAPTPDGACEYDSFADDRLTAQSSACSDNAVCAEEAGRGNNDDVCCTDYEVGSDTISSVETFMGATSIVSTSYETRGNGKYERFYVELPTVDTGGNEVKCPTDARKCEAYCYSTCEWSYCASEDYPQQGNDSKGKQVEEGYDCSLTYKRDFDSYECTNSDARRK